MKNETVNKVLGYYKQSLSFPRIVHSRLRTRIAIPFGEYDRMIPAEANILSFGCGLGFLELYLACGCSARRVLAVDNDERRIKVAKTSSAKIDNIKFEYLDVKNIADFNPPGPWNAVIMNDLLHHIENQLQENLIRRSSDLLCAGGLLIIKDIDASPGFFRWCNTLNDRLFNGSKRIYYRSEDEYMDMLRSGVFTPVEIKYFVTFPFKSVMIAARKRV